MLYPIFSFITRLLISAALCLFSGAQFASAQNPKASPSPNTRQIVRAMEEYMNASVKAHRFSGSVLVARDGSPIFKKSYGMANYEWNIPNTSDTAFRIASVAKQFTAMAVMILQERGKLNVGDPICKYLENCPPAWQPITIRNLLTHTSGIPNFVSLPDFQKRIVFQPYTYASFVDVFRNEPLDFAPGEKFNYSNSAYFLLGLIIERVSGKSYAEFLRDSIFVPLEMKNTGYDDMRSLVSNRAAGYVWTGKSLENAPYLNMLIPFAAGGLYSTTEDLFRWEQALYTEKLVSRKSLDEIFTPFKGRYGYGWFMVRRFKRLTTEHEGGIAGFSASIIRFPEERTTFIVLNNNVSASAVKVAENLAAIVFGAPYEIPKPPITEVLAAAIEQKGIEFAVAQFRQLKQTRKGSYDFSESLLNALGYDLLRANKVKEAIEIFKLNVEGFPQSANAHDSLAEAYETSGNKEMAIKHYEKVLEVLPGDKKSNEQVKNTLKENALRKLEELKTSKGSSESR